MVNIILRNGEVHKYHNCWVEISEGEWPIRKKIKVVNNSYSTTRAIYTDESVLAVVEHEFKDIEDGSLDTGKIFDFSQYN